MDSAATHITSDSLKLVSEFCRLDFVVFVNYEHEGDEWHRDGKHGVHGHGGDKHKGNNEGDDSGEHGGDENGGDEHDTVSGLGTEGCRGSRDRFVAKSK
jgi:hypothetical protein